MQHKGIPRAEVERILRDAYEKDRKFAGGRILCSMNTTAHELAVFAHSMFIEANLGNVNLYPGTKELEERTIEMLKDLLHGGDAHGGIVNGGTEANITALWLARKLTGKKQVIYPESVHFSINKAVDLLGLKPVPVPVDSNYCMDVEQVKKHINPDTAAVIAVAGSTELGVIDPVEEIAELTGDNIFMHVDAAFGGMVIPFLKQLGYSMPAFDFEIGTVDSVAVDPHKMGLATHPAGALLIRDKKLLEKIAVDTPYLTMTQQAALAGTRNSAAVASAFAVMSHLGREGYCEIVKRCMDVTGYFKDRLEEHGFELAIEPVMNIINIIVPDPAKLEVELAAIDWWVSKSRNPPALRFVVMPHVTKNVVDNLIPDLIKLCKQSDIL